MLDLLNTPEAFEGYGESVTSDVQDLMKALQAQEGITDIANLVDVGALQPQSLEMTLVKLTFGDQHLTLWKDIPKGVATSTLEEYSVLTGYGQEGGFVGQMESPLEGDPTAERKFAQVKFARDMWKISHVSGLVNTIKDAEVFAKEAALLRLLRRMNTSLYSGNQLMIPEQIDGFETTIENNGSADHVIDLRGVAPSQQTFRQIAELIQSNYGSVNGTNVYTSPGGMTTIDSILGLDGSSTSTQRYVQGQVGSDGGISIGSGVKAIHTSFGTMRPKVDNFLASEYDSRGVPRSGLTTEGATSQRSPNAPSFALAIVAATVPGSLWGTGVRPADGVLDYSYRVASGNRFGLSIAAAAKQVDNVAAGGSITVTITPDMNSTYPATFYEVYGEQVAGSGDFKFIKRVAATGATPVVFTDLNTDIPGTTKMFVLDMTSVGEQRSFMLKQLAPVHSKEYATIGEFRWGTINIYPAALYYAPLKFALIKNVPIGIDSKSKRLEL